MTARNIFHGKLKQNKMRHFLARKQLNTVLNFLFTG